MSDIPAPAEWQLTPEEWERVDRACDRFEAAWQSDARPTLAHYVEELETPAGKVLLRELLRVEIAYRAQKGEQATAGEYQAQFPVHANLVAAVFAEVATTPHTPLPNSSVVDQGPPPPSESSPAPEYIDRYKVLRWLGGGTYGDVYLAHDAVMDRQVAIKVPSAMLLATERAKEEFLREARSVARLQHEGIVRAYDFGEADGRFYIVYEFVDGESLAERIKPERLAADTLPHDEAARIVVEVAEALHYAHLQEMFHRDIKPANILLDRHGRPKVADFGLAVREQDLPQQRGVLAGTYAYMSPEQVRREGHLIDGRADVYSLGVVLYELLCGRRPFRADTEEELKEEILCREPRPPRQVKDSIPQWLERICLKALSKRIIDRYTTAKDMADELRRTVLPGEGYLHVEERGEATILTVVTSELLGSQMIERFKKELSRLVRKSKTSRVILDFSKVERVESTALGALIWAHKGLTDRGGRLCICGLTEGVFEVFDLINLTRFFDTKPDLASALGSVVAAPLVLEEVERRMASADEGELRRWLDIWVQSGQPTYVPLVFRCLAHSWETVREQARKAVQALGWEKVSATAEELARGGDSPGMAAVLDGLAAFEAHPEIVGLLDRLVVLLKGNLRNRTIILLERKRLGLELNTVAELFRNIHSPYRIEKVLGQGLFAAAYLSNVDGADLQVVVRVLRPEFAGQPLVRAQFLDLNKRALQLVHENLVVTREARAFSERNIYYAVRDYVDGVTLQRVLEGGKRFEPAQVVNLLRQLLAALAAVHRRGMSHGGVKPSNIFLCGEDRVILGDPSLPAQGIGVALERLSYDYRYAAPESFLGAGAVRPQGDFYAVGCVAYELACGQPPFVSDNYLELAARHLHEAIVEPSQRGSSLGSVGDEVLLKLLARSPAERFAKVEDALRALDQMEESWRALDRLEKPLRVSAPEALPPSAPLLRDASLARYRGAESVVGFDASAASLNLPVEETFAGEAPPSASTPEMPNQIGPYQILERLGQGGMGVVYKARDPRLERVVAIKVVRAALDTGVKERFKREALAVARLQHPHFVQIYDIGEQEGSMYLALEYLGGRSLAAKLRAEGPQQIRPAAETVAKLARAMQHAHERGILHRDLKPANILFTEDAQLKITDFGLAHLPNQWNESNPALTQEGMIVGTPSYMAPEQAAGNISGIGPATDVYGLGAILYDLLTGRPPFRASQALETLSQVATQPPIPPSALNSAVDRALEAICLKCLEKESARRYPSAAALADDLDRWLAGQPIQARPATNIRRLMRWCRLSLADLFLFRKRG